MFGSWNRFGWYLQIVLWEYRAYIYYIRKRKRKSWKVMRIDMQTIQFRLKTVSIDWLED